MRLSESSLRSWILGCLVLIGTSSLAFGLSQYGGDLIYYSDSTYTVQVGEWLKDCSGHNTHFGTTTSFYLFDDFYRCSGGGGSGCSDPQYQPCIFNGQWACCG